MLWAGQDGRAAAHSTFAYRLGSRRWDLPVRDDRYNGWVADSVERLSYELTTQALGEQERSLSGLRTRAGTVLAAASISGSFLGTKASQGSLDVWSILALLSFGFVFLSGIWVLLPRKFTFSFAGSSLLAESDRTGGAHVDQAYRAAVLWMDPYVAENRNAIERLFNVFSWSCVLLAAEIVLWTISLA